MYRVLGRIRARTRSRRWVVLLYSCLLPLSLIFVLHVCAQTRTLFFSGLHRAKTLTIRRPHLILLVRRSRDVVRNTYVTPKLIRYNFTGRLGSSISPYRIQAVGLPARLPCLPCLPACLPARCLDCQPVSSAALVIGFPRFSQLFLKSFATLSTLFSRLSSYLSLFGARVVLSTASSAFLRALARVSGLLLRLRNNRSTNERLRPVDSLSSSLSFSCPLALSSAASIALFRCEGSLKRLKKLNCAFIVDYLGSCLNVSRERESRAKQPV